MLARVWTGEAVAPARKARAPLFRDFAARYRERRSNRWKPSSLKTFDIYMRGRLLPRFANLRLDRIDHARVSAWFDAASAERPGAATGTAPPPPSTPISTTRRCATPPPERRRFDRMVPI